MNVDSILQEIGAMKTKMNKKEKIVKTPEEAIETIEYNMPTIGYRMLRESLIMAIGALEKQKPKKCDVVKDKFRIYYNCPTCNHNIRTEYNNGGSWLGKKSKYCTNCGQMIQWVNENLEGMEDRK